MTKNQIVDPKHTKTLAAMHLPFVYPKIVGSNKNFLAITLNQLLMLCRMCFMIYSASKLASLSVVSFVHYADIYKNLTKGSFEIKAIHFSTAVRAFANLMIMIDTINPSSVLNTFGDYVSRMNFSRFSSACGINVHVMRLICLTISMYNDIIPISVIGHFRNMDGDITIYRRGVELIILPGAIIYILCVAFNRYGGLIGNEDLIANPWIEDWQNKYEFTRAKKLRIDFLATFLLICNLIFLGYFCVFFVEFKFSESVFYWDAYSVSNIVLPLVALGLLVFDSLYRLYRRSRTDTIFTSMLFNILFVAFFILQMYIESVEYPDDYISYDDLKVRLFVLVKFTFYLTAFDMGVFLVFHLRKITNFVFWSIKWGMSIGGMASIIYMAGSILIILSGIYATYSLLQDYFYFHLDISKEFKAFLEIINKLLEIVIIVIDAIKSVLVILDKFFGGVFCIVIAVLVLAVLPILAAVGWGSPIPGTVVSTLLKLLMAVFQAMNAVRNYMPLFKSVGKFSTKASELNKDLVDPNAIQPESGGAISLAFSFFGIVTTACSFFACYYYSAERYSELTQTLLALLILIVEVCAISVLLAIFGLEFILSQKYNMKLFTISLFPGWGLIWVKVSLFALVTGIMLVFVGVVCGRKSGYVENKFFSKVFVAEEFVFPSFLSIVCPLFTMPKDAKGDENSCMIIFNRFACCLCTKEVDELEGGTTPLHYLKYMCFPCAPDPNDPEDVNRECPKWVCPCCDCRKPRCCNFFRLRRQKQEIDDSTNPVIATNDFKKDSDYQAIRESDQVYLMGKKSEKDLDTEFSCTKRLKTVFSNGFRKFPQYLIPIVVGCYVAYILYLSLTDDWITLRLAPQDKFNQVLTDTSTMGNSDQVSSVENTKKTSCPVLDAIKQLLDLVVGVVFKALKSIFPSFKKFFENLEKMIIFITELKEISLIPIFLRFAILLPAFIFLLLHCLLSIVSSFFKPINRLIFLCILSPLLIIFNIELMAVGVIKSFLKSLPLLKGMILVKEGYAYAVSSNFFLFLMIVMTVVDHFMPPTYPLPSHQDRYVEVLDEELEQALSVI